MSRQPIAMRPPARSSRTRMTFQEFLRHDFGDAARVEWVDGEIIRMAPVSNEHSDIQTFLLTLIRAFADTHRLGDTRCEPFVMKTGASLPGRSPDILFVASAHRSRLKKAYLQGPADLVVEVISSESRSRDRNKKFNEYERGGVREYWLIDQPRTRAEFFSLAEDGKYRLIPIAADSVFRSIVLPGLWLRVDWLWESPLPSTVSILRQWGVV